MTSVNYLIKEISAVLGAIKTEPMQDLLLVDAINKAKEMHYKEMKNAWYDSTMQFDAYAEMNNKKSFDDYYNETFKKD